MMRWIAVAVTLLAARVASAEEVDVTAGVVTGLSCALRARETRDLTLLTACPPEEARKEMVVVDVAEGRIYRLSRKKVHRYELAHAYGGGSIDFTGEVVKVEPASDVAVVDVSEYTVTRRPKPGAFKGCM